MSPLKFVKLVSIYIVRFLEYNGNLFVEISNQLKKKILYNV